MPIRTTRDRDRAATIQAGRSDRRWCWLLAPCSSIAPPQEPTPGRGLQKVLDGLASAVINLCWHKRKLFCHLPPRALALGLFEAYRRFARVLRILVARSKIASCSSHSLRVASSPPKSPPETRFPSSSVLHPALPPVLAAVSSPRRRRTDRFSSATSRAPPPSSVPRIALPQAHQALPLSRDSYHIVPLFYFVLHAHLSSTALAAARRLKRETSQTPGPVSEICSPIPRLLARPGTLRPPTISLRHTFATTQRPHLVHHYLDNSPKDQHPVQYTAPPTDDLTTEFRWLVRLAISASSTVRPHQFGFHLDSATLVARDQHRDRSTTIDLP